MNAFSTSDTHLVRRFFAGLPWLTITLVLLQCAAFIWLETGNDSSFFSLQAGEQGVKQWLAFNVQQPEKHAGLAVLTSFFAHLGPTHFFSNLPWLILFAPRLERSAGRIFTALLLTLGHITALSGAWLAFHFFNQPALVIGMSGGVLAISFASLMLSHARLALVCFFALAVFFAWSGVEPLLVHSAPMILGLVSGFVLQARGR